jgi:hypothetical protein
MQNHSRPSAKRNKWEETTMVAVIEVSAMDVVAVTGGVSVLVPVPAEVTATKSVKPVCTDTWN